jgi:hypothetical protein
VSRQVEFFHGRGARDARPAVRSTYTIKVLARPTGTAWDLIFVRSPEPTGAQDVRFECGGALRVAIAVWNGAAGDRGPQKSIGI